MVKENHYINVLSWTNYFSLDIFNCVASQVLKQFNICVAQLYLYSVSYNSM